MTARPASILIAVLPAFAFFLLNSATPKFADDYCRYAASFDLPGIITLVVGEYTSWTGRFPVIFVSRAVFSLGDTGIVVFNLVNTVILFLMARTLVQLISPDDDTVNRPEQGINWSITAAIFVSQTLFYGLLWFTLFRFGEVTLWKTGAIQYLWGCGLALFALRPVFEWLIKESTTERSNLSLTRKSSYLLLCFLGGAWLENLSVSVVLIWLGCVAYNVKMRGIKTPGIVFYGFCAWTIGTIMLIAAPGNYARSGALGDTTSLLYKLPFVLERAYYYLALEWVLLALVFLGCLLYFKPSEIRQRLTIATVFASLGLLTVLAMSAAPIQSFVSRAAFPFEFFLICSVISLTPTYLFTAERTHSTRLMKYSAMTLFGLTTVFFVALSVNFIQVFKAYRGVNQQSEWRQEIIAAAQERGQVGTLQLPALYFSDERNTAKGTVNIGPYFARDITDQPDHWRNKCFAEAHGISSVRL